MSSKEVRNRILFVDDDPDICEVFVLLLNEVGFAVSTAANGFDALAQLNVAIPDIIVCDLNMPRMSGFEFLSVARRQFPSIPLIAMSASFDSIEQIPIGVVADAFYAKGHCRFEDLFSMVTELLQASATQGDSLPLPWSLPSTGVQKRL